MHKSDTSSTLVSIAEVAEITGLDAQRISRMIRAGDLEVAHKLPGRTGAYLIARPVAVALAERLAAEAEERAERIRTALAEKRAS